MERASADVRGKAALALATGNSIVGLPSEISCLAVIAFIDEITDLVPPGVVSVVTGYGPAVGEPC